MSSKQQLELFFKNKQAFHFLKRSFRTIPFILSTSKDVAVQAMKKLISVIVIVAMVAMLCVGAASAAEGPVSPGPEGESDGIPEGSHWGPGPAPSAGDCEPDGPEWPDWPK